MREITEEQIYQKLNGKNPKDLENLARRLRISAVPYRRNNRKEDLVDAIWFSMDNEFPRDRLVKTLFGRSTRTRKKTHILKKHAVRLKYKLHTSLRKNRKTRRETRRVGKKASRLERKLSRRVGKKQRNRHVENLKRLFARRKTRSAARRTNNIRNSRKTNRSRTIKSRRVRRR